MSIKKQMQDHKNRNREKPSFANINLQGPCNYQCYFCLGNDINEGYCHNYLNIHFSKWKNFDKYLIKCKEDGIKKIYLTGQNTDPLLYKYLKELIDYLKNKGFLVGIRTNGVKALEKIDIINSLNDEVGLSIHSLTPEINKKITNHSTISNWDKIIKSIKTPLRIAIVVTRYNKDEILNIIKYFSKYKNINYIQLRCISTDERYSDLKEDIICYKELTQYISKNYHYLKSFYTASIYNIYGIEVCLWKTIKTTINSYNYFTNGIISTNYFIVEGYKKHNEK